MQTLWLALAFGLMIVWLAFAVIGPCRNKAPGAVLRYGGFWRTLALVLALMPPMIMVYAIWGFPWLTQARMNLAGLCFLATSIVAGFLLIDVTRLLVVVGDEGLVRHSAWSGPITLKWIEVERIGYSPINRWFTVEGAGRTIRVSRHLDQISAFVQAVRRHVVAERCTSAATALDAAK